MADEVPDLRSSLRLTTESPTEVRVDFQPSRYAWKYANPSFEGELPWAALAGFDTTSKTIRTYPIRTGPSFSVLCPKYGALNEIAFEGLRIELPLRTDDIEGALSSLPDQFYTEPESGLGIRRQFRPLIDVLHGKRIRRLVITWLRETALERDTLILARHDFTDIAYELERIAKRFSKQSRLERSRHAYNELLSRHFPERFPRDETPYRKGILLSFLRRARESGANLSVADRLALVEEAAAEATIIAKRSPQQLYKLQRDFELAGLNGLIERFGIDLEGKYRESHWQSLLKLNPFILSMLFGYPIAVDRDQAHLGGAGLDGSGDTIADFLVANKSTKSLALVEIKRPDMSLTGHEFRKGRWSPSSDLNNAVIQVIDQRYELLVNYKTNAHVAGNVHGAVDCIVVAGRTPTDPAQLSSFEMYRTSLRDVQVLTFDEVLLKLRALRDYLEAPKKRASLEGNSEVPF